MTGRVTWVMKVAQWYNRQGGGWRRTIRPRILIAPSQPFYAMRSRQPKLIRRQCLLGLLIALMTGCGGDSAGPDPVDPTLPAKITILPVASTKIFIGLTLQLQAVVTDGNGDTLASAPVTWSSDGPDNASISSQGLVTGIQHGTVIITATSGALSVTHTLHVIELATYIYTPVDTTLDPNQVVQYTITGRDIQGVQHGDLPLFWSSAQGALATVTQTGTVTAQESDGGNVQITFTIGSLFGRLNLVIAPAPVATVTVSTGTGWVGEVIALTYQLLSFNGVVLTNRPVTWSSSDLLTATVQPNGQVTGLKAGSATITVTSGMASGGSSFVVKPLPSFQHLTTGGIICGLSFQGELFCWTEGVTAFPAPIAAGFQFTEVGTSGHMCGLASGVAYCWGANGAGQLGDGSTTDRTTPTLVSGGLTFAHLAVGNLYTCGVTIGGTAYCWGANTNGELGNGTTQPSAVPVEVSGGHSFSQISAGRIGTASTCGITSLQIAWCWGANNDGQLGTGDSLPSTTPRQVIGGVTFQSISVSNFQTCGISTSQVAYCWGPNVYGGLGDGTLVSTAAPHPVLGGNYSHVVAGYLYSCGLATGGGGNLKCWGWNESYQLGDGTQSQRPTPVTIGSLGFTELNTAARGGCGLTSTGRIYCWGGGAHTPTLMKGQVP